LLVKEHRLGLVNHHRSLTGGKFDGAILMPTPAVRTALEVSSQPLRGSEV
jgi:hypothetical protein